ncbi:MAG: peptide chain release factor N(5)-glutamine methyltransferase [Anaerolineales bacterium]|nr:peptide chain release factor N(5)-glutamine methyltransferase [Anaerolineales bacterium]
MVNESLHSQLTIGHSQLAIKSRLAPHTDTPALDAQVLLAHVTGHPRAWLLAHPEAPLTPTEAAHLEQTLQQLENGLPLPYVLGEWEFFGLKFKVTPEVLIPRPETELLVETALEWLKHFLRDEDLQAADIGTGSGCIAISLAVNCPQLHILATDLSPAALALARQNAALHQVSDRITFLEADLLAPRHSPPATPHAPLTLITANLPYIPTATLHTLDVYGREPTLALNGGPDGLTLIRRLLAQTATRLAPGGLILLEIEATQGASVTALARQHYPDADIRLYPDLAGYDRLLSIQTPSVEIRLVAR